MVKKTLSYRFPDTEFEKELSRFSSLRDIDTHLQVRVRIHLCRMVLFSKKKEGLGALHRGKMIHWKQVSYKSCIGGIWDYKRQPGNQMAFHVILVVPLDADEYNDIVYSGFSTDCLKGLLSSVER